jgi:hypothetical protein
VKTLRRTCTVTILCMALAVSAVAGQIDSTGYVAPPPTGPSVMTTVILTVVSLIP